jgi:hypothetical protein
MAVRIEAQIHLWPWSYGIREHGETMDLTTGIADFRFWGSPVVSVSTQAKLFLPQRYEQFVPFGPPFRTLAGEYRLYEMPHGVMAARRSGSILTEGEFRVHTKSERVTVHLRSRGAKPRVRHGATEEESELARAVLAWSQFFDDLIEKAKEIRREAHLTWSEIEAFMLKIAEDAAEPRMALIVDIAERLHGRLPVVVNAARKILLRERRMLPAGRVAETDTACLRWTVRQPGETIAQKAAVNRQQLLGIARRESFDTLENRVLKDFLGRCTREGHRYLKTEVGDDQRLRQSTRAHMVSRYRHLCSSLCQTPSLEAVAAPPPAPRPNYVLQNDHRYRQIWHYYVRLLRRDDEEDRIWDWQARMWADVARLLVNTALYGLSRRTSQGSQTGLCFEELLASAVQLRREQHLGSRIVPGSEPGPFMVNRWGQGRSRSFVLEVVHSDQAGEHLATRLLGRLGGHLYLVLTPLAGGRRSVIVVWAVHTAGAETHPEWENIASSADQALRMHTHALDDYRDPNSPALRGFVVASDMTSTDAELYGGNGRLPLVTVPTDQRCWDNANALAGITAVIESTLETEL